MIRFIDLRNQGTYFRFAFWNTNINRFIDINGSQAWDTEEEFVEDLVDLHLSRKESPKEFESSKTRFLRLMPDWAKVDDGKGEDEWEKD